MRHNMKFTLIDHDKMSIFKEVPYGNRAIIQFKKSIFEEDPYGNRAIIQFEDHAAAQAAFTILENELTFEATRVQYILGRSIVINKLSDAEYEKMLNVLNQANEN